MNIIVLMRFHKGRIQSLMDILDYIQSEKVVLMVQTKNYMEHHYLNGLNKVRFQINIVQRLTRIVYQFHYQVDIQYTVKNYQQNMQFQIVVH